MNENEVVESVKAWLKKIYPQCTFVSPSLDSQADLSLIWVNLSKKIISKSGPSLVPFKRILLVECKGSKFDFHRAVGQCLDYLSSERIPIFLAIPEDSRHFKGIKHIIDFFNLQIGILLAKSNRKIKVIKGVLPKAKKF